VGRRAQKIRRACRCPQNSLAGAPVAHNFGGAGGDALSKTRAGRGRKPAAAKATAKDATRGTVVAGRATADGQGQDAKVGTENEMVAEVRRTTVIASPEKKVRRGNYT
jgi:hypothetical protein